MAHATLTDNIRALKKKQRYSSTIGASAMKQPLLEINNDDQFDDLDILEQERLKQSKVQGWNPDDSLAPPKAAPGGSKAASPKASD